jgi:hypothetical protein
VSLKVGDYYGFNFVIYEDSIIFAMEKGVNLQKIEDSKPLLKELLGKMHTYNIIHNDIKP